MESVQTSRQKQPMYCESCERNTDHLVFLCSHNGAQVHVQHYCSVCGIKKYEQKMDSHREHELPAKLTGDLVGLPKYHPDGEASDSEV